MAKTAERHSALVLLVVSDDGRVDCSVFERTRSGRNWRAIGQRVLFAPWSQVLAAIAPGPEALVLVRHEHGLDSEEDRAVDVDAAVDTEEDADVE